jgi:hypothetical protein
MILLLLFYLRYVVYLGIVVIVDCYLLFVVTVVVYCYCLIIVVYVDTCSQLLLLFCKC